MRPIVAFSCALLVAAAVGCGGPQKIGGSGDTCFRDNDCAYGLICTVPEGGNARVCTSDVGGLISLVDAGAPTAGSTAGGAAAGGAGGAATGGAASAGSPAGGAAQAGGAGRASSN